MVSPELPAPPPRSSRACSSGGSVSRLVLVSIPLKIAGGGRSGTGKKQHPAKRAGGSPGRAGFVMVL